MESVSDGGSQLSFILKHKDCPFGFLGYIFFFLNENQIGRHRSGEVVYDGVYQQSW